MSFPASATDRRPARGLAELVAAGSLEISPREMHQAGAVAALLPANTCVYLPSLPGLPFTRTLQAVAALRAAGLDPVPHVAARRIVDHGEFRSFLSEASAAHGVHRVMLIGGDIAAPLGPYADSLALLESGMLRECGIREIGIAGYPEGHPRIPSAALADAFRRKMSLAREQGLGLYVVTQFSFAPARVVEYCAAVERKAPGVPVYVGVAGPTDAAALARYAQRCGVSVALRALRTLGAGIAKIVTNTDPLEQVLALTRYCGGREACNVVGVHLYSFGGAVRTAEWMRTLLA